MVISALSKLSCWEPPFFSASVMRNMVWEHTP